MDHDPTGLSPTGLYRRSGLTSTGRIWNPTGRGQHSASLSTYSQPTMPCGRSSALVFAWQLRWHSRGDLAGTGARAAQTAPQTGREEDGGSSSLTVRAHFWYKHGPGGADRLLAPSHFAAASVMVAFLDGTDRRCSRGPRIT